MTMKAGKQKDIMTAASLGMVDVGLKKATVRAAKALAVIYLGDKAYRGLIAGASPKGDVLEVARIAGVMAAKSTPQIIPYCHTLLLESVKIDFEFLPQVKRLHIKSEIKCSGKTGVEMEALTAVSVAALTVYDMMKWADKGMVIEEVRLLSKKGGKSGDYEGKQ